MFESLHHLRKLSSEWQDEYNEFHPHQSLNNLSPNKYLEIKIEKSNLTQFEKWGTYRNFGYFPNFIQYEFLVYLIYRKKIL